MFEADALCDRIAVIAKGDIVAEGTPRDLKALVTEGTVVEIETFDAPGDAADRLRRLSGVASVGVEEREQAQVLIVQSATGGATTQQLLVELGDVQVGRVSAREPTLEDAYVSLVGESV
jgi:ABC-2 type transport system ATP-binding protein